LLSAVRSPAQLRGLTFILDDHRIGIEVGASHFRPTLVCSRPLAQKFLVSVPFGLAQTAQPKLIQNFPPYAKIFPVFTFVSVTHVSAKSTQRV
jgi:hypothetical protein